MTATPSAPPATLGRLLGANADPFKGLLVLLVVADHNEWLRHFAPDLFRPLTFHVLGFLLLGFAFAGKGLSWAFVRDRACRYLVPFWWMLALTGALYALVVLRGSGLATHGAHFIQAALWGNAPFVKAASGFLMLWYLPCMFGLSVSLAALQPVLPRAGRPGLGGTTGLWLMALTAHLAWPLVPARWAHWLPFGLGIVIDVLFIGLVWLWLLGLAWRAQAWLAVLAAFVVSYGVLVAGAVNLEIATLELYGIDHPLRMLLQDVAGLGGVLLTLKLASLLGGQRWLAAVGRHSLLVYLLHPLVYQVLAKLPGVPSPRGLTPGQQLAAGLATAAVAAACAWMASVMVASSPRASAWLLPRGWFDWPPTAALSRSFR